jgi:hypothetical protein
MPTSSASSLPDLEVALELRRVDGKREAGRCVKRRYEAGVGTTDFRGEGFRIRRRCGIAATYDLGAPRVVVDHRRGQVSASTRPSPAACATVARDSSYSRNTIDAVTMVASTSDHARES